MATDKKVLDLDGLSSYTTKVKAHVKAVIDERVAKGTGTNALVFQSTNASNAIGDYSIAIGTAEGDSIEGLLGSYASSINVNNPKATACGSIAFGGGAESKAAGSMALGALTTAGVRGFYWRSIDITNKKITLSTNQTKAEWSLPAKDITGNDFKFDWKEYYEGTWGGLGAYEGDTISIVNGNQFPACAKIMKIEGNVITVDNLPFTEIDSSTSNPDDRTIFACYKKTEVGADLGGGAGVLNSRWYPRSGIVEIGWATTAFGVENLVTGAAAFVGGFNNWQAGNFGATFGRDNIGGYCGVTAGFDNENYGNHGAVIGRTLINNGPHNILGGFENTIAFSTETDDGNSNNLVTGQANVLTTGHRNAVSGYKNNLPRAFNCAVSGELNEVYGNNHIVAGKNNKIKAKADGSNSNASAVFGVDHDTNNKEYLLMAGRSLIASNDTQCVVGKFNTNDLSTLNTSTTAPSSSELTNPALMIGNGSNANTRATSCAIGLNGNIRTVGHITANGTIKSLSTISGTTISGKDIIADSTIVLGTGNTVSDNIVNAFVNGFSNTITVNDVNADYSGKHSLTVGGSNTVTHSYGATIGYKVTSTSNCSLVVGQLNQLGKPFENDRIIVANGFDKSGGAERRTLFTVPSNGYWDDSKFANANPNDAAVRYYYANAMKPSDGLTYGFLLHQLLGYTTKASEKKYAITMENGTNDRYFLEKDWTTTTKPKARKLYVDLPAASGTEYGVVKTGYTESNSGTDSNRNYAVKLSNGKMYVNVPWKAIGIESVYPIGSIYMTAVSDSPETLFSGTIWEKISDAFTIGSKSVKVWQRHHTKCPGCSTYYDTQAEADACKKQEGCPKWTCPHTSTTTTYSNRTNTQHTNVRKCNRCGTIVSTTIVDHSGSTCNCNYKYCVYCGYYQSSGHIHTENCNGCGDAFPVTSLKNGYCSNCDPVCYHDARLLEYCYVGTDGECDNATEHMATYYCYDCDSTFTVAESHSYSDTNPYECACGAKDPYYWCPECGKWYQDCFGH